MIKQILYKWFGIEDAPCASCELLRNLLVKSEYERRELLAKLLDKELPTDKPVEMPTPQVIRPVHVPWFSL